MNKHKKGSIFGIIGLVVIFAVVSFLFFSMISDQIFFKHVKSDIKIEKLNVTLNDAAKKQINNYTSQQVSNKKNDAWRDASATEIKSAMDSGTFIDNEKQKYQFLDLSKYQGIDKNRIKRMLVDRPTLLKHTDDFLKAAKDKHVNEVYLISHALLETGAVKSE
ncbi:autolysin, partial [Staphylococcus aureus]|nr:autolysin [Staphylococcus aureus]